MKKQLLPLTLTLVLTISCTVGPKPIDYGHVACHYCSMTIVDKHHAAQLVTTKGKVFNFDAIECMMHELKETEDSKVALYLANDFDRPGVLVDATSATYLISESIPSPMGAYLSAFAEQSAAQYVLDANGGQLLSWSELKQQYE